MHLAFWITSLMSITLAHCQPRAGYIAEGEVGVQRAEIQGWAV